MHVTGLSIVEYYNSTSVRRLLKVERIFETSVGIEAAMCLTRIDELELSKMMKLSLPTVLTITLICDLAIALGSRVRVCGDW